jgi:hypothetical protein
MPDQKLLSLAAVLRARAEEVLAYADAMKDADAQGKMRRVASTYAKLARQRELHAGDLDKV